jgi:hypothetical protein
MVPPSGLTATVPLAGTDLALDSNPNPAVPAPSTPLPGGGSDLTLDFGLVSFMELCPPDGHPLVGPAGTLTWSVDIANDRVYVRYEQSRNINDNSYGTTRVGWGAYAPSGKNHNFADLVGSDKAEFAFTNADGTQVLRFVMDYITRSNLGAPPSGYRSLGVTGGDGSMIAGNASSILAYTTSLARNLNDTGYCVGGNCGAGGTDLLANSPPTVGPNDYTFSDATYDQWDFTNAYEVVIDGAAFGGAANFGTVALVTAHNSPPKAGNNALSPVPCDPSVPGTCSLDAGTVTFKKKQVKWPVTNTGVSVTSLTDVTLTWPATNGALRKIKIGKDVVWQGDAPWTAEGITLSAGDFVADTGKREIGPGKEESFTFEFDSNADTDLTLYQGQISFGDCVLDFPPLTEPPPPPVDVADFCVDAPGSGKPKTLTFVYTGENCTSNCNEQGDKATVVGNPASATPVYITASSTKKGKNAPSVPWFEGEVNLNEDFMLSSAAAAQTSLGTNNVITITAGQGGPILSTVTLHTSCSVPLLNGDFYGSLRLDGFSR